MSPAAKWEYMKTVYERYRLAEGRKTVRGENLCITLCPRGGPPIASGSAAFQNRGEPL